MSTLQVKIFTEPRAHLWTSEEYYKVAEAGLFEGKRVELNRREGNRDKSTKQAARQSR